MSALKTCALVALLLAAGAAGCATPTRTLQTPQYTLTHPYFWKVKSLATKVGEPTVLSIGRESTMVMDGELGPETEYEKSQAEVEAYIVAWPAPPDTDDPAKAAFLLLRDRAELQLAEHGRLRDDQPECGREFKKEFTLFGVSRRPLDMMKQPGWRTIIMGATARGLLYGVLTRVPFEQDARLFCHNLINMHLQLAGLLGGLTPVAAAGKQP